MNKHHKKVYDDYDEKIGLDKEGLFFVSFLDCSRVPDLYAGKLRDVLDYVIQHKNFFLDGRSTLSGCIYEAKVNYIKQNQAKEVMKDKLKQKEELLLLQLQEVRSEQQELAG